MNQRYSSLLAFISMALAAPAAFAAHGFDAGFATADITPPTGWRRAGGYTEFLSRAGGDPLLAKAIVLSQGPTTVALLHPHPARL